MDWDFYKNKTVLVTGHTGFKGSWMCKLLSMKGANVVGYSLNPPTDPALFDICKLADKITSVIGDVRDLDKLKDVFEKYKPEIVIHMAAQPLVRESYLDPVYTFDTNIMGTVNVLECVRQTPSVKSVVNVTTDKVYKNKEWEWGYREDDELNGFDPYSNSKSCSELVTSSYINSFFADRAIAISTMRAGNVIGGGDFAKDRIIPDCVRAATNNEDIIIRNPYSVRPFQHVLEPVVAYLQVAKAQYEDPTKAGNYNVGPKESDCKTTGELTDCFCQAWSDATGNAINWINKHDGGPHEAGFLKLDCSRIRRVFGWEPKWKVQDAIRSIVEWSVAYNKGEDIDLVMEKQIEQFLG